MKRLASLLCLGFAAAHPDPAACLIQGSVWDARTSKPLAKTRVFAKPRGDKSRPAILHFTDEMGAFCFERLEPGQYEVAVERSGYINALYGARPGAEEGMLLIVDGQTGLPPLTIKMTRAAAIGGIILDSAGEPREGARVTLDRKSWDHGWSRDELRSIDTDDRGAFRFPLLAPGTYYVSVYPEDSVRHFANAHGKPSAEVQTWYNGSLSFARATPIPLQAGQEIANLVLTQGTVPLRHLSGRLSPSLHPGEQVRVRFDSDAGPEIEVPLGQDGTFSVDTLAAAKYRVTINLAGWMDAGEVDLTNGDVDGFEIGPQYFFEVRFSARVEGGTPSLPGQLSAVDLEKNSRHNARQEAGGTYLLRGVPPGIYRLHAHQSDRVFVKTLLINGQAKSDLLLDLRKGQPDGTVEVVLSPNVANIEGHLDRSEDALPSLITTVVIVDEAGSRTEVVGDTVTVDHSGKFKFESLAPGKYRVFAIAGFEEGLWGSLELAAALREKSLTLELHESETKSLAIPAITPEEWTAALRKAGM